MHHNYVQSTRAPFGAEGGAADLEAAANSNRYLQRGYSL